MQSYGAAELFRDALGVPHLRADDELALADAQGRVTAIDRGWQIEVDRWRAEGRLAEHLGPAGADWDRFARGIRLADTAERAYRALAPDDRAWVDAYVIGVNEGLAVGRSAAEFDVLAGLPGRDPEPTPWPNWAPLGVFLVAHVLFSTFPHVLWRQHVASTMGVEQVDRFAPGAFATGGSNAWALHGSRTASGRPILAGDPHRLLELPGVYQQVRLACPEYDVVGLSFPGVPGVAHFGHTGAAAWGITNAIAHHVEVFRERLRTRDGLTEALGPDGWEPARTHVESFTVRAGSADGNPAIESVRVVETERGPVVVDGPGGCFSVRLPARVDADLGFGAFRRLLRARTAADVAVAFDGWVDPVNRVLAADRSGTVLRFTAGRVPHRTRSERRLPLPAWSTTEARWRDLPVPEVVTGVAVDANERPDRGDHDLGYAYPSPARAERIRELLDEFGRDGAAGSVDAEAMTRVHADVLDRRAQALVERLRRAVREQPPASAAATDLADELLRWNVRWDADDRAGGPVRRVALGGGAPTRRPSRARAAACPPRHGCRVRSLVLGRRTRRRRARIGARRDRPRHPRRRRTPRGAGGCRDGAAAPDAPDSSWGDIHRLHPLHVLADVPGADPPTVGRTPARRRQRLRPLRCVGAGSDRCRVPRLGRAVGLGPRRP